MPRVDAADDIRFGAAQVTAVYLGATLIWQPVTPEGRQYGDDTYGSGTYGSD